MDLETLVRSKAYLDIMGRLRRATDGVNSAELRTRNYRYRHGNRGLLGAWRWLGLLENRDMLIDTFFNHKVLDFGGARGPISPNADICDIRKNDCTGRDVKYQALDGVPNESYEYVWSSHTLEHIEDIVSTLLGLRDKLEPGGKLILHLPAYTCERWRADSFPTIGHRHTFCLSADRDDAWGCKYLVAIDILASQYFTVERAEMCGDNSIFMVLKRDNEKFRIQ